MSKVKVSKARIIELASNHSKREVAKELGITVITLNKLVNGLNIVFKARRNKYELVDDTEVENVELVSEVNPIIHQEVAEDKTEEIEVSNITNTSVPVEEDTNF